MTSVILKACHFAAEKHKSQRRKDGTTPYINHPLEVASILADVHAPVEAIAAGALHDTLEDTDTTETELRAEFGDVITDIVLEVTDDKSLSQVERKRAQIAHAPHMSDAAKQVKLADKLSNCGNTTRPVGWSETRFIGYQQWAWKVCEGLFGVNERLDARVRVMFEEKWPRVFEGDADARDAKLAAYFAELSKPVVTKTAVEKLRYDNMMILNDFVDRCRKF